MGGVKGRPSESEDIAVDSGCIIIISCKTGSEGRINWLLAQTCFLSPA